MTKTIVGFSSVDGLKKVAGAALGAVQPGNTRLARAETPVGNDLLVYLSKNDSGTTWSMGSSHSMNIYCGTTWGSETSQAARTNGVLQEVYIRMGDIPNGAWIYILEINSRLEAWVAQCNPS